MPDSYAVFADPLFEEAVPRWKCCSGKVLMLLSLPVGCVVLWGDRVGQHLGSTIDFGLAQEPITTMAWPFTQRAGALQSSPPVRSWTSMTRAKTWQSVQPASAWQSASPDRPEAEGDARSTEAAAAISRRRGALLTGAALLALSSGTRPAPVLAEEFADDKMVGALYPESTIAPGLYAFKTGQTKTATLRAELLSPYSFAMPGTWKELGVSNAISGNYCLPKCGDQTTELKFAGPKQGDLNVIIVPIGKLRINKQNPTLEEVGNPDAVIEAVGQSITNSVNIEAEEVVSADIMKVDGKTYYLYNILTPFAKSGLHNVAAVTTDKNYLIILCVASNEKQWSAAQDTLMQIPRSFRVGPQYA